MDIQWQIMTYSLGVHSTTNSSDKHIGELVQIECGTVQISIGI